ncbi:MAG: nuclear transport factor 2 family protein, partial [Spirochaetaceae bacterium]
PALTAPRPAYFGLRVVAGLRVSYTLMYMDHAETVRALLQAENERDWETWKSLLHEDVVYYTIGTDERINGKENYAERMQDIYQNIPDWTVEIRNLCSASEGETVVCEFVGSGHYTGVIENQTFSQVPVRLTAVCVYEFVKERIMLIREYLDPLGFERQLKLSQTQQS